MFHIGDFVVFKNTSVLYTITEFVNDFKPYEVRLLKFRSEGRFEDFVLTTFNSIIKVNKEDYILFEQLTLF